MEIRIAAIEAFRRMPCNIDVSIVYVTWYSYFRHKCCINFVSGNYSLFLPKSETMLMMSLLLCPLQRTNLLDTMYDKTEDAELRIFSYMGLMQCPTSQIIQNVKNLLESEENMQGMLELCATIEYSSINFIYFSEFLH